MEALPDFRNIPSNSNPLLSKQKMVEWTTEGIIASFFSLAITSFNSTPNTFVLPICIYIYTVQFGKEGRFRIDLGEIDIQLLTYIKASLLNKLKPFSNIVFLFSTQYKIAILLCKRETICPFQKNTTAGYWVTVRIVIAVIGCNTIVR